MTTFCWKQSWFFEVCVSICYGILFLVGCHLLLEPIFPCPPFLRLQSHMFSKHLLSKILLTITSVILSRLLHDLEVSFNSFSSYLAPHIFNALLGLWPHLEKSYVKRSCSWFFRSMHNMGTYKDAKKFTKASFESVAKKSLLWQRI